MRNPKNGENLRPGFWDDLSLEELNPSEWEALCDGCGKCCLLKLEDADTGEVHYTGVACRLFDHFHCRCRNYAQRLDLISDCILFTPESVAETSGWMPETCAYRLRHEGKPLPAWHYLKSGDKELVHSLGHSLRGKRIRNERGVPASRLEDHVLDDPSAGTIE
ncbi:MAG: YcgN family cysteine cluster protein [Rhodobacteraceae bacterium]|nr:YcgN family cysteine cluster protein [Paracoccaceae bacterium]